MSDIQGISQKLGGISSALAGIQQGEGSAEHLNAIMGELGQLAGELKAAQSQVTSEMTESARQELVRCRMGLHQMLQAVSDIRSNTADQYRQALGEQKQAFEQLTEEVQLQDYPEAYGYKQLFHQMGQVSGQIHDLDRAMMDTSYQLGRSPAEGNGESTADGAMPESYTGLADESTGWS